jgi:protein involved in sex pheromone biosynthesis
MKKIIQIAIVSFVFFLAGCSGKINKDNYDKISNGMSISQVESILGKGESQASSNVDLGEYGGNISSEVMTWQSGTKVISITFSNGKVMAKAQNGL